MICKEGGEGRNGGGGARKKGNKGVGKEEKGV